VALVRKDILNLWIARAVHTRSIGITRALAKRYGERLGFVYVGGYPKSGTTWMSQLVAHYLDIPFPDHNFLPLSFKCVVHHHFDHLPAFDHSFQVVRDGRDVMVSMYMNLMRAEERKRDRAARFDKLSWAERGLIERHGRDGRLSRRFERLLGRGFDPWDKERNLPIFIEADMRQPLIEVAPRPWPQFVRRWRERGERTVTVKYEEMLGDTVGTFGEALSSWLGEEPNPEQVSQTVERYAFKHKTGRSEGDEDRGNFRRKGVSGDWRNHFNREAREVFDHYAGDVLIELGYETDRAWVEQPRVVAPTTA